MAFTYDPATTAGRVRLLVNDVDGGTAVFTDAEIDAFVELEPTVYHAAARCLLTVAGNETLRAKYVRSQGLELDGPAVGRELRQQAAVLEARGDRVEDEAEADADEAFLIAAAPDSSFFPDYTGRGWRW